MGSGEHFNVNRFSVGSPLKRISSLLSSGREGAGALPRTSSGCRNGPGMSASDESESRKYSNSVVSKIFATYRHRSCPSELGRAIVDRPAVVLLDEPTSGLEEAEVERFGAIVVRLTSDTGCSVGLVEHNMSFVMGLCKQIVVLNLGTLLAVGTPKEIQENAMVTEAYLGS
jgi:hypothetical protein